MVLNEENTNYLKIFITWTKDFILINIVLLKSYHKMKIVYDFILSRYFYVQLIILGYFSTWANSTFN